MPILQSGIVKPSSGYTIDQSLRFNDDDSAYLNRTAGTATANDIGTFSFWTKRGNLGGGNSFFSNHSDANNRTYIGFDADTITMFGKISGSANVELLTTPVFRDPGAWYHIVIAVDVTQSTASNRVKIYVNGTQITDFGTATYPAQNTDLPLFSKTNHQVGAFFSSSIGDYYDGYLAEYHYIDGQQLAPASFGETNSETNQWVPVEYEGSYGNNGFYLKFQDASALGDDSSGNTNDFTVNNLVATDQVIDSPTNNFCVLNPLDSSGSMTASEGNLRANTNSGNNPEMNATFQIPSTGKWYWEFVDQHGLSIMVGVIDQTNSGSVYGNNNSVIYSSGLGTKYNFSSSSSYGASWTTGDIIGVAINRDDNEITFYKNNSSQGTFTIGGTAAQRARLIPAIGTGTTGTGGGTFNFGQDSSFHGTKSGSASSQDANGKGDFFYAPPANHLALCSDNLPNPAIALPTDHFNTNLWTGNGSTGQSINVGFQPDLLIAKERTTPSYVSARNSVTGVTKSLFTGLTNAEYTETDGVTAFTSTGFNLSGDGYGYVNRNTYTYVGWNWKAGGTASSNGNGTITSSVSANTDAGFSIVSYTGTGANATVGHGLSQRPDMFIVKNRSAAGRGFVIWAESFSGSQAIEFDTSGVVTSTTSWNSSLPTSTVINLGTRVGTNESGETFIAYCFHSVDGYSKVGSYEGNANADGPFVYTGFQPAFVIIKGADQAGSSWFLMDNKRDEYNVVDKELFADANSAEGSGSRFVDFNSNGFKLRANDALNYASTMIYYAVAESPFKYSNAR